MSVAIKSDLTYDINKSIIVCLQCAYNFEIFGKQKSCKLLTYRTLTFGCPDGLEPSTFRTTI